MDRVILTVEDSKVAVAFKDHFANMVLINQSLNSGAAKSYVERGLIYVDVPSIVGITGACENVDTLFRVGNQLGLPLFFSQTGQLSLEQALQSFPGVWTVIHSGRDEKEDSRHLRQFRLTEEEFDATTLGLTRDSYDEDAMYNALLVHIQGTVQAMLTKVLDDNQDMLATVYGRDVRKLRHAATTDFLRITYEDAVRLLQIDGHPTLAFGDDLSAEEEARIVALLNDGGTELPVLIMKYPKEIKFFNMKVSTSDPRVCLSADLIFPYSGEGVGSSVREHDFERLRNRLLSSTMYALHTQRGGSYDDFRWYLDIMEKEATSPHAGYGIGNERVLQYIFGESDIRNVSTFALLNVQTRDWEAVLTR